jgi:hypothetical protein
MSKNKDDKKAKGKTKGKAKAKSKAKDRKTKIKSKTKKKKNDEIKISITNNKKLDVKLDNTKMIIDDEKLNKEFMILAKQKIEYTELINEINKKLNNVITLILSNNNKYSSIADFININNLDEKNIEINEQVLDSFDE